MLTRHIIISCNSNLIPLQVYKQIQRPYQLTDYNIYQSATLNPEQIDNDVLVSSKFSSKAREEQRIQGGKGANSGGSILSCEAPQNLLPFRTIRLPKQLERLEGNHSKEVRIRSHYPGQKECVIDKLKQSHSMVDNSTFTHVLKHEDYSLTPIGSNKYPKYQKVISEEQDHGILNKHAKSSIVNGEIYRTLEKLENRNSKNQAINHLKPLPHKKYSYTLPKSSFIQKNVQKIQNRRSNDNKKQNQLKSPINLDDYSENMREFRSNGSLSNNQKQILSFLKKEDTIWDEFDADIQKNQQRPQPCKNKMPLKNSFDGQKKRDKQNSSSGQMDTTKQIVLVSYKTSLSQLKQICSMKRFHKLKLVMKIPQILASPLFNGHEEQSELFEKSQNLLSHLQINYKKSMSIKKYNNCILIVTNDIAIAWHYNGKVFLGGWKQERSEDGHKNGLGLQWSPKKYVYYGQFLKGRRHGIGIMKNSSNAIFAGIWHENNYVRQTRSQ